jgi:hypothetical protein
MRMRRYIEGMGVIPSHEFFFASVFETFSQCDHVIYDVAIVGNDTSFESFDGEGEDVGDDEGGGMGMWSTEEEAHDFYGGA